MRGWLLVGRECRKNAENRLQFICAAVVVTLHSTVLHIMVLRYFGGAGWQPPNGTQASEALQHCAASLPAPMPTAPSAQRVCVGAQLLPSATRNGAAGSAVALAKEPTPESGRAPHTGSAQHKAQAGKVRLPRTQHALRVALPRIPSLCRQRARILSRWRDEGQLDRRPLHSEGSASPVAIRPTQLERAFLAAGHRLRSQFRQALCEFHRGQQQQAPGHVPWRPRRREERQRHGMEA